MRYRCWRSIIILVLLFGVPSGAGGADEPPRPKIGLVLSGGGARGAAHIGVLKVLEEMCIPVDYIAGTSMGAIVGGLYAAGVPLAEIEKVGLNTDWSGVFLDRLNFEGMLSLWRKNGGTSQQKTSGLLPQGLAVSTNMEELLKDILDERAGCKVFADQTIPFKAVATDIETGEMVVLDQGPLYKAVMASMAVPGIFSPVEIDGRMLIDGGVVRNLPVDVVRAMGADVVIAVNVGSPLFKKEELGNFIRVTNQIVRMVTYTNTKEQIELLQPGDLLIEPELHDLGSAEVNKGSQAIDAGYVTADKLRKTLSIYSVNIAEYEKYQQHLRRKFKGSEPRTQKGFELWGFDFKEKIRG